MPHRRGRSADVLRGRITTLEKELAVANARMVEFEEAMGSGDEEEEPKSGPTHGDVLTKPFTTCQQPGRLHRIQAEGNEWWLCWRHPDGQWVTETPITLLATAR